MLAFIDLDSTNDTKVLWHRIAVDDMQGEYNGAQKILRLAGILTFFRFWLIYFIHLKHLQ